MGVWMNVYDDIKKLYEVLSRDDTNVEEAENILRHLKKSHRVDKAFIEGVMKTVAIEKMMLSLFDKVENEGK